MFTDPYSGVLCMLSWWEARDDVEFMRLPQIFGAASSDAQCRLTTGRLSATVYTTGYGNFSQSPVSAFARFKRIPFAFEERVLALCFCTSEVCPGRGMT